MPFDVAVIGNVGIDTNVYLRGSEIDFNIETNFTENIDYVGQAGGYASRGYAALGKKTIFIGQIGDDFCGAAIRKSFQDEGIDSAGIFIDPKGTSRSINIMYPEGKRKNFYDGKSHMVLKPDFENCRRLLTDARFAHFNIPNWARYLLPLANELNVPIACDLQDVVSAEDPYRKDFLRCADFLFFSAVNRQDPTHLITDFQNANPKATIVTGMGSKGCAFGDNNGIRFFPAPEIPLPVVDTNGAGDCLAVGFLTSFILEGYSIEDAILRGQICARHTCSIKAPKKALITKIQLDDWTIKLRNNDAHKT
jgi:sugar/nucleoside kinase (ribokinase family)